MGITIVADAGAANANSFAGESAYIGYVATRLNAPAGSTVTGDTCSEVEKAALIEATRELVLLEQRYEGQRVTMAQSLSWPRQFAINPDAPEIIGVSDVALLYFLPTIVPQRMIDATCELAMQFLKAGTTDIAALDATTNVASKTTGPLSTSYVDPTLRAKGLGRFPRVMQLIGPLLDASRSGGLTMVRC